MRNLFLVTSALHSNQGIISPEDRFEQTVESLINLRQAVPDDVLLLCDGSPNEIPDYRIKAIAGYVDDIVLWNKDQDILKFSSAGRKSEAEVIMLYKMLHFLRENEKYRGLLPSIRRIFKFSARTVLLDKFDISSYNDLEGKYVFKKAIPSWLPLDRQKQITDHLYITRFYSLCPSLIQDYINTIPTILNAIINDYIDTEHAHFKCINKQKVVEFDNLHCEGIMAGTSLKEVY